MTDAPATRDAPWPVAAALRQAQGLHRPPRHGLGRGRDHPVGRLAAATSTASSRTSRPTSTLSFTVWSSMRARSSPRSSSRATTSIALRQAELVGQGRHRSRCRSSSCGTSGSATCSSGSSGCARQLAAEGLFDADRKKPLPFLPGVHRPRSPARTRDAEKDVLRNAQLRWPSVRVPGACTPPCRATAPLPRWSRAHPRARRRPRGRRHHRRPRRRRLPEPPRRSATSASCAPPPRASTPIVSGDRARGRPAAARRGRRPARVDADGCREAGGARRRRGARPRRSRPARGSAMRVTGAGLAREIDRIGAPALASGARRPRLDRRPPRRGAHPLGRPRLRAHRTPHRTRRPRASPNCAGTCARSRRRRTLERGYAIVHGDDGTVVRDAGRGRADGAALHVTLADGALAAVVAPVPRHATAPSATPNRLEPCPPTTDVAELSYEQARDELVRVVTELEQGSATLEQSLALWERGEALAARCEEWLVGAKARLDAARAARPARASAAPDGIGDAGGHRRQGRPHRRRARPRRDARGDGGPQGRRRAQAPPATRPLLNLVLALAASPGSSCS